MSDAPQRRLIDATEECVERDLLIQEKEKLCGASVSCPCPVLYESCAPVEIHICARSLDLCISECARRWNYAYPNGRAVGLMHIRMAAPLDLCISEWPRRWNYAYPNARPMALLHIRMRVRARYVELKGILARQPGPEVQVRSVCVCACV